MHFYRKFSSIVITLLMFIGFIFIAGDALAGTFFKVGTGFTDVIPRQIVRTNDDKLYIFTSVQYSSILKAFWTNSTGLPSSTSNFNGTTQVTDSANIISVEAVYDGGSIIHVLVNTQGGILKDYPFDKSVNAFKSVLQIASGNPTVSGSDYIGSSGVSGMFDATGKLHIAYWSGSNHIAYKSYTYNAATNVLTAVSGPTQLDISGSANHPILAVSPVDNSVTVAWVSEATSPAKILSKTMSGSGTWGSVENVSTGNVWISANFGINIDQGPSLIIDGSGTRHLVYMENFDSTGDYGKIHYAVRSGTSWSDTGLSYYTHDPALAINSAGEIYILGHGHPKNSSCTDLNDICTIKKSGSVWGTPQLFAANGSGQYFDCSVSVKWSVVGWNRPETIEFVFFNAISNTSQDAYYGRIEGVAGPSATPTLLPSPSPTPQASGIIIGNGDANSDGSVNANDIKLILQNWLASLRTAIDQYGDGKINAFDLAVVILHWPKSTPSPSLFPSASPTASTTPIASPSPGAATEWTQLAHDAQRTGYTFEDPSGKNWSFAWHWQPSNMTNMPKGAHAVTGGNYVYMPAGAQGMYAINKSNGGQAWVFSGTFNGAPAYDTSTGMLFAASADTNGMVYKINSSGGNAGQFSTGSAVKTAVLLTDGFIYVANINGDLYKINPSSMAGQKLYSAGSPATTPVAYSAIRQMLIYGTKDLNVHAVGIDGAFKWKVKPTSLSAGDCVSCSLCNPYSYEYGWPVVADLEGVVFMRMRLGDNDIWLWSMGSVSTNAAIKTHLDGDAQSKALFALDLTNGSQKFTPAVENGGVDDVFTNSCGIGSGKTYSTIGPIPAVKTIGTDQVAYIPWRSGDVAVPTWDARWNGHMGEMVMDSTAVSGYTAGDMRFIKFNGGAIGNGMIADEFTPVTVAGNSLFHAHWGASESVVVGDRSSNFGATLATQINSVQNPVVLRRLAGSGTAPANRLYNGNLTMYCDPRVFPGSSGFFMYWNMMDPPTPASACQGYGEGITPRYTFVSDKKIYVVGNGGDIFALNFN